MSCPLHGLSLIFAHGGAVLAAPSTPSNRCPLITDAHAPCRMEVEGNAPDWATCPRNPDNYERYRMQANESREGRAH